MNHKHQNKHRRFRLTNSSHHKLQVESTNIHGRTENSQQDSGATLGLLRDIKSKHSSISVKVNPRLRGVFTKLNKLLKWKNDHLIIVSKPSGLNDEGTIKKTRSLTERTAKTFKIQPYSLANLKIEYPALLSQRSEIIHHFSVLTKYLILGLKKKDFEAEDERSIIEAFEQLNEKEQIGTYEELKTEYYQGLK